MTTRVVVEWGRSDCLVVSVEVAIGTAWVGVDAASMHVVSESVGVGLVGRLVRRSRRRLIRLVCLCLCLMGCLLWCVLLILILLVRRRRVLLL